MKEFILIQLEEIRILSFIVRVQNILNGQPSVLPPHITVKGPYTSKISVKTLESTKNKIKSPIIIKGADFFDNPNELVLYFKTKIEDIEKIWYKPSYPISKYGLNPHITLYKGKNRDLINQVIDYFDEINLCLLCNEFSVLRYLSLKGQMDALNMNLINKALSYTPEVSHEEILNTLRNIVKNVSI